MKCLNECSNLFQDSLNKRPSLVSFHIQKYGKFTYGYIAQIWTNRQTDRRNTIKQTIKLRDLNDFQYEKEILDAYMHTQTHKHLQTIIQPHIFRDLSQDSQKTHKFKHR